MTNQTLLVVILASMFIYGTTRQSSDNESHNNESTVYPDTGIQVKYYPNGFPKYAIETVKPGIFRTTEWYPDGVIRSRKIRSEPCDLQ